MSEEDNTAKNYLKGQILIAMPGMADPRFQRTVLYVCAHSHEGAMGLVLNRVFGHIKFSELLGQLGIPVGNIRTSEVREIIEYKEPQVHFGGPVESGRGFVLHSADFMRAESIVISEGVDLTGTLDIVRAIAEGQGPQHSLFALGYAGWGPGQLDAEIQGNGWMIVPPDSTLLFDNDLDTKWERAFGKLGINLLMLSEEAGHA